MRLNSYGVFINKSFAVFDNTVFRTLEREGKRLNYDIVVFASAGYYLTESDYDIQEKNIFHFAAIEKLDGLRTRAEIIHTLCLSESAIAALSSVSVPRHASLLRLALTNSSGAFCTNNFCTVPNHCAREL